MPLRQYSWVVLIIMERMENVRGISFSIDTRKLQGGGQFSIRSNIFIVSQSSFLLSCYSVLPLKNLWSIVTEATFGGILQ